MPRKATTKVNPETPVIAEAPKKPRVTRARTAKPAAETETVVSNEEIARLAYHYWESRGRQDGYHEQDWLRAETELRAFRSDSVN